MNVTSVLGWNVFSCKIKEEPFGSCVCAFREVTILTQRLQSVSIAKTAAFLKQFFGKKKKISMLFRTQNQREAITLLML